MYPKHYIDYFRKFNREEDVFIAMPFSDNFELRYKKIYEPVIRKIGLNPNKVNNKYISNSILIDILQGISDSKLIMVDITMDENGYINSNVMYELGLAQATRMPEEVVVVTSCDIENCLLIQLTSDQIN